MDTQTKLMASVDQAKELLAKLDEAIKEAETTGMVNYVRVVLEQMGADGPWRLVIGVCPDE